MVYGVAIAIYFGISSYQLTVVIVEFVDIAY